MSQVPFQVLGANYDAINTITLSNRPGVGCLVNRNDFSVEMEPAQLKTLLTALHTNGLSHEYDVILSG